MFVFIVNALSLELGMMSFGTLDIYTKGKEGRKEVGMLPPWWIVESVLFGYCE